MPYEVRWMLPLRTSRQTTIFEVWICIYKLKINISWSYKYLDPRNPRIQTRSSCSWIMMLLYVPSLTKSTKGEGRWSQLCCLLLLLVALCPYYLSSTWVIVKLAMKKSDDIELCLRAWKWEAIGKKVKRRICTLTVATTTLLSVLSCATNEKHMNRLIGPNVSLSPHLMYLFSVRTTLRPCKNYTKTDVPKQCTPTQGLFSWWKSLGSATVALFVLFGILCPIMD
jgi:hypothetical protein